MKEGQKSIIKAISTMFGLIIGAGIFGVPYVVSRVGFGIGIAYLTVIGAGLLATHLFYADVVVNLREKHRLIGAASVYLGRWGKRAAYFSVILGMVGSLVAYIIIGGSFMHAIFGGLFGGTVFQYQIVFFALIALATFYGLRLVSAVEIFMTALLVAVMAIILGYGAPHIDLINLSTFNPIYFFLPYGVILFALSGLDAIPEIRDVLKGHVGNLRLVIVISTLIPLILVMAFTMVVVGVTGDATSPDAILGLAGQWGDWIKYVGAIFGFLAIATSVMVVMVNFKESLTFDLKMNKYLAWFTVSIVPLIVFLAGANNFISIIGFTGAIFGGINGILIVLMYLRLRKNKKPLHAVMKWPMVIPVAVIILYALGIVYELLPR
ncbi:MAG: aromatic amino acid transport family protein [Patescibacteria group bacterium]|nr:aromatic amino acid transport family protein [Patescibacteria group bacterium]